MNNKPILFSGPMVRSMLDGRKTQTRRMVKPQPNAVACGFAVQFTPDDQRLGRLGKNIPCPYGKPGDLLWVRETCRAEEQEDGLDGVVYEADSAFIAIESNEAAAERWLTLNWYGVKSDPLEGTGRTVPSIHMPRWAFRITLRITDVRVERLQDISEADAIAEGVRREDESCWVNYLMPGTQITLSAKESFVTLWQSINGLESWDANPWVWAVSFDVIRANVNDVMKGVA